MKIPGHYARPVAPVATGHGPGRTRGGHDRHRGGYCCRQFPGLAPARRPARSKESTISDISRPADAQTASEWHAENEHIQAARQAADALGAGQPSPVLGATLRTLAATLGATHAVEVGTGTGVTGLWLFQGMAPDGVLTSIDRNSDHQRAARDAFAEAGISPTRARLIAGEPHDVLTRLTDAAYDMVVVSGDASEYPGYWAESTRLVRPGGAVVFREASPAALAQLAVDVRESENWLTSVLPIDGGLLVAVRQ